MSTAIEIEIDKIQILIADDHPVVRAGLKQILADNPDIVVGGEAVDAQEVIEKIREEEWDVVILDYAMPGGSGLETLKEIKRIKPDMPILMLSMYSEDQLAVRCLKAAASGYLAKESAPEELVKAIRKVRSGGKYVSSSLAEKLATAVESENKKPAHEILSDREYQVLCFIASGKKIKDIARELTLSERTVRTFRARLLEKMGLKNDVELTHYAIKNSLLKE